MTQIFGNPKCGWCNFQLGDFAASLSYLTDVMYDTLEMCLDYLQTGGGTVQCIQNPQVAKPDQLLG